MRWMGRHLLWCCNCGTPQKLKNILESYLVTIRGDSELITVVSLMPYTMGMVPAGFPSFRSPQTIEANVGIVCLELWWNTCHPFHGGITQNIQFNGGVLSKTLEMPAVGEPLLHASRWSSCSLLFHKCWSTTEDGVPTTTDDTSVVCEGSTHLVRHWKWSKLVIFFSPETLQTTSQCPMDHR